MAHTETPTVLTVPNLVSTSRVLLAVGFLVMDAVPVRLVLIAVASLTDFLDGWIARRTKVASRFGALIDPVADQLAVWQAVVIFFRDIMSLIGWFTARNVSWLRPIRFRARPLGKMVTALQLLTFIAVLLAPATVDGLVIAVGALGLVATVDYTLMLWRERVR